MWTASQRLDASEEFLERERLRDVIVGPRAERGHLRVHGILRGEDEHWSLEPASPKRMQHFEARFSWETHVQHDQIVRLGIGAPLPFLAIGHQVYRPPVFLEAALYVLPDGWIVFDDENPHDN